MDSLTVYLRLAWAQARGQMQYRVSFLLQLAGAASATFTELLAVLILFRTFGQLAGWSVGDVAVLYGVVAVAFGLAEMAGDGFEDISTLIRMGQFDRVLTRPIPPFVQVMASQFPLRRLGRVAQGVFALWLGQHWLHLDWTPSRALVLASAILSTAAVFVAIFVIGAALCFWTVERTEAQNVFTYGGTELSSYPVHIYSPWLRAVFLYVVPLGLTTYYPALYVLSKPDPLGLPGWVQLASPLIAAGFFAVGMLVWRAGLNHYQSTGS